MDEDIDNRYVVKCAGANAELRFSPRVHCCGNIINGVAFEFGHGGSWVIDLDELKEMIVMADAARTSSAGSEG